MEEAIIPKDQILLMEKYQKQVSGYTLGNIMRGNDLATMDSKQRLIFLQVTPDKAVKTRRIGATYVPYVEIGYVERALNFVSNFDWGFDIIDKGYIEYKNAKDKTVYEAWVQCKFYIVLDGTRIERSAFGSWTGYENPAVSRFAVYESAKSMATKSFADTLGIGSDKIYAENEAIRKVRETLQTEAIEDVIDGFSSSSTDE